MVTVTARFSKRKVIIAIAIVVACTAINNHIFRSIIPSYFSSSNDKDQQQQSSQEEAQLTTPQGPIYPILPKKLYTVVGLESSGTTFTSKLLASAAKARLREGAFQSRININPNQPFTQDVEVQHVSLPEGQVCSKTKMPPIVDAIMPPQCILPPKPEGCHEIQTQLNQKTNFKLPLKQDPGRFILNITSYKEFYDSLGVDHYLIIVVRDSTISLSSRVNEHCHHPEVALAEEEAGMAIIQHAVNHYILGNDGISSGSNNGNDNDNKNAHRRLSELASTTTTTSNNAGLPSGNNVVLVSYELMNKLGQTYIQMLYKSLGIESNYAPEVRDGNEKYIKKHPSLQNKMSEKHDSNQKKKPLPVLPNERNARHVRKMPPPV